MRAVKAILTAAGNLKRVMLNDDEDVVYGLADVELHEFLFCSRFCRNMFSSDLKFAEHKKYIANQKV